MRWFTVLLFTTCVYLGANGTSTTVELVHLMFRHGDRTPDDIEMNAFPNYDNVNKTWHPIGKGHLTNEGILHMFRLGEAVRTKYRYLFQGVFNVPTYETIRTFTTEYPRTRTSALSFLAGLLPPAPSMQWGRERDCQGGPRACRGPEIAQLWRPTTYIPDERLNRAVNLWTNCPAFFNETQYVQSQPEMQDKFAKHHRLIQILSANVGQDIMSPAEVWTLRTLYEAQEAAGIAKPTWVADNWNEINEYIDLFFQSMFHNDIQKRFGAGVLLKKILDDSQAKARGAQYLNERKMFAYSGHDTTLIPLFAALGGGGGFVDARGMKVPIHFPDYTAALAIEVHRSVSNGKHGVRFFYANGDGNFRALHRSDCADPCPLEQLVTLTQAVTYDSKNIERDCSPTSSSTTTSTTTTTEEATTPDRTTLSTFPTESPPPETTTPSGSGPTPGFPGQTIDHLNDDSSDYSYEIDTDIL